MKPLIYSATVNGNADMHLPTSGTPQVVPRTVLARVVFRHMLQFDRVCHEIRHAGERGAQWPT